MLMKFLILMVLIVGALVALRLVSKASTIRAERRESAIRNKGVTEELVACGQCGGYHIKGEPCECSGTPTP